MVDWTEHVDVVRQQILVRQVEYLDGFDLEGQVLGPVRVRRLLDGRLVDQVEEGNPAAVGHLEEQMAMRRMFLSRWHSVLRDHMGKLQAQDVAIEVHGLLGVSTPIRNMIKLLHIHTFIVEQPCDSGRSKISEKSRDKPPCCCVYRGTGHKASHFIAPRMSATLCVSSI